MPTHTGHTGVEKLVLNKTYDWVSGWMDEPFNYLHWTHRTARHTPLEFYAHFSKPDGTISPEIMNACLLHLVSDEAGSADPVLRALIDAMGAVVLKGNDPNAFNRVFIAMMLAINR